MVFSSFTFLTVFLPVFLLVYYIIPAGNIKLKNISLLLFSLVFYAAGEPVWIALLLFSAFFDYVIGLFMTNYLGKWQAKVLLGLSLCGNLGILIIFKYGAFLLGLVGIPAPYAVTLPIGISFYTFQTMSYTLDLYKGKTKPQRDITAFFAYVAMFPQLVAGPIVRYGDIKNRLTKRKTTFSLFGTGVSRFAAGLAKKVILANHAGKVAAELLGSSSANVSTASVWLGAVMFMFQIYFDFSGYSDMAIGLGRMIGFNFKENFDRPYTAKSITEFWRRWHISLSSFFKDYVYIPLGGNRRRAVFNLLLVWMLTGLWHGASINFIIWGLYFGVILAIEKYILRGILERAPSVIARVYSLTIVLFGWVIFYFTDLDKLAKFSASFWGFSEYFTDYRTAELFWANIWILPVFALFSTGLPAKAVIRLKNISPVTVPVINLVLLCASFIMLVGQTYNPFLYFRF